VRPSHACTPCVHLRHCVPWCAAPHASCRRAACMDHMHAGQWRGLPVAIKTMVFQSDDHDCQISKVASEVAIASNLVHHNIVATYSHDICPVGDASGNELGIYKFYLIQVCEEFLRETDMSFSEKPSFARPCCGTSHVVSASQRICAATARLRPHVTHRLPPCAPFTCMQCRSFATAAACAAPWAAASSCQSR
jgi:hypothetical protein